MLRYYLWLLAVAGLIIIIIFLVLPGGKKTPVKAPFTSYAYSDSSAQLTIDGPIVANQVHQSLQINVNPRNVTYKQFTGYDGQLVNSQTYDNTTSSYSAFLHALSYSGFTLERTGVNKSDYGLGICSTGNRYIFEFQNNNKQIEKLWATSCNTTQSFAGNLGLTLVLFKAQIPNYNNLTLNLPLT